MRFGRWLLGLLATAQSPLSVIPLLLHRRIDRRADFRVGRLVLSARRTDLVAISEIAIRDVAAR